jgi:hypothetical protein
MFVTETHCHTRELSACGRASAEAMIEAAYCAGLDALIITDHHVVFPQEELRRLADQLGAHDLVILSGFEAATYRDGEFYGDFLVLGADHASSRCEPEELVEAVHDAGGALVAAHPCRWGTGPNEEVLQLGIDGVEVLNGNNSDSENALAQHLAVNGGLPTTGGSDAHRTEQVGRYVTVLERRIAHISEFIAELRAGRVRPAIGEDVLRTAQPRRMR